MSGKLVRSVSHDNSRIELKFLKVQSQICGKLLILSIPFLGGEIKGGVNLGSLENLGLVRNQVKQVKIQL